MRLKSGVHFTATASFSLDYPRTMGARVLLAWGDHLGEPNSRPTCNTQSQRAQQSPLFLHCKYTCILYKEVK